MGCSWLIAGPARRLCGPADGGGHLPGLLKKAGTTTRIYPLGTWLTPCGFSSGGCHEDFMLSRVAGTVNLTELVGEGLGKRP